MKRRCACCTSMRMNVLCPSRYPAVKKTRLLKPRNMWISIRRRTLSISTWDARFPRSSAEAGARWLLDPDKIYDMVSAVVENVSKPVTVKMRTGWDSDHIYAVENVQMAERAGAAAISMHGRTREQMYEGAADWDIIRQAKGAVSIPVIGNGDVTSPELAEKMLHETGVDAVMIGREALGNPWMIYRTVHYLETGEPAAEPEMEEKMDIMKLHMDRLIHLKGEKLAVLEMRKHASWYLKGIKGNGNMRRQINQAETRREFAGIIDDFMEEHQTGKKQMTV